MVFELRFHFIFCYDCKFLTFVTGMGVTILGLSWWLFEPSGKLNFYEIKKKSLCIRLLLNRKPVPLLTTNGRKFECLMNVKL